jgi:tetratricopeptide (TPR) repeat protein
MTRASTEITGRLPARIRCLALLALMLVSPACSGPAPPAVSEPPRDSLATILSHADGAFRDGDFEEAEGAYDQALRIDPDLSHAVVGLATCLMKDRRTKKAEDLLVPYLARRPGDVQARLLLARVYVRESELDRSAEALRSVLQADPDNLVARYNLGFVAYRSRRYDEARDNLQRAIGLRPDHVAAHYTLGLTDLAQGRAQEAIAELEKAVSLDSKHVGAHFNLIGAYARVGDAGNSRRHQRIYAELSGRSKAKTERETQIKAESIKAIRMVLEKKYGEALAEYETLAARYPDDAGLEHQIGLMHLRLGHREQAVQALEKSIALDPGRSDPHYLLSNLYREMGAADKADREMAAFAALEAIPEGKSGY